jgi:hypothetical protein
MSRYKNEREHTTLPKKTNRGLVGTKIFCLKLSTWSGSIFVYYPVFSGILCSKCRRGMQLFSLDSLAGISLT